MDLDLDSGDLSGVGQVHLPTLIPKYHRPSSTIFYNALANCHVVTLSLSLSNTKRRFYPILSPNLYIMCFITFMDISNANLVFANFTKKLGSG